MSIIWADRISPAVLYPFALIICRDDFLLPLVEVDGGSRAEHRASFAGALENTGKNPEKPMGN